ncbi:ATP-binding cassette domain-containing protein [Clostridium botulinum]|uniref:ATP-binding cassette domain-containing protein n=1 Tax=Clostridium botulinum TaxID=1491 RepID=UPI0022B0C413|nr:ATP-binding cassette domain-containing protein [Clostridium botulinum]
MDNIYINKLDIDEYRGLFAVMSQETHLFNTTIKDNIDLQDKLSAKEIRSKCIEKNIEPFLEFIEALPDDFETTVGIRGSKLSGGEKQKIGLIRTLLKRNSKILILDEATSNYDM